MRLTFDTETTTKNKGHPFTPGNRVVSYSIKWEGQPVEFHHYIEPDFLTVLRKAFANATELIGFNLKFDLQWALSMGIRIRHGCAIFDCSLAEYILTGQEAIMVSLDDTLADYGLEAKDDGVKSYWDAGVDTIDIPIDVLSRYGNRDVDLTEQLAERQKQLLQPAQLRLVYLSGRDLLTLVEAERNGIKYNFDDHEKAIQKYSAEVATIREKLKDYIPPDFPSFLEFNWESGDQLSAMLYGGTIEFAYSIPEQAVYKSGPNKGTEYTKNRWHIHTQEFPKRFNPLKNTLVKKCTGPDYCGQLFYQVDDPTLKQLKSPVKANRELLELLGTLAKKVKVVEMLSKMRQMFDDLGWEHQLVHGQYNQNVTKTGRLSSSKPNMQNTPGEVDILLVSRYDC